MNMPAGRTSSVEVVGKNFILQTEFLTAPRQRIVSSITLGGRVIHKVERPYEDFLETEEDLAIAEKAVIAQHGDIARKIKFGAADFLESQKVFDVSEKDRLGLVCGASFVVDIDEKLAEIDNPPKAYLQSKLVVDIAKAVCSCSRVGGFKAAALVTGQGKFVITRRKDKNYLLSLKPDADIKAVLEEVGR